MSEPVGAIGEYWWHVHHGEGLLFEMLTEPAETRREFIRSHKPPHEVETRLRLFRPVRGNLDPPKYWQEADAKWQEADARRQEAYAKWQEAVAKRQEADAKWQEADAKWREADAKWQEADAKRQEAYAKWREAYAKWQEADAKWQEADAKWRASTDWSRVEALHRVECPNCPWNGETIFP